MQKIMQKFNKTISSLDIFDFWQDELHLRIILRKSEEKFQHINIKSIEELEFLKRSLYYGNRQDDFWVIIFHNSNNMYVLKFLIDSPRYFLTEFLQFLPLYIQDTKPPAEDLRFLINIYHEDFNELFIDIVKLLDLKSCQYLMDKTANNSLLQLLKNHYDFMNEGINPNYNFFNEDNNLSTYPTFYGDKKQLVLQAVKMLNTISYDKNGYKKNYYKKCLDISDTLFRAGFIEDCIILLFNIMDKYRQNNFFQNVLEDETLYKQSHKILRKAIPLYALLDYPADPYNYALNIYKQLFCEFQTESASLLYLDLYRSLIDCSKLEIKRSSFEILNKSDHILSLRSDDTIPVCINKFLKKPQADNLDIMYKLSRQRIYSLPHESFIITVLICFLSREKDIQLNFLLSSKIINDFLQFFAWIPSPVFINNNLILIPQLDMADKNLKHEIKENIELINRNIDLDSMSNTNSKNFEKLLLGTLMGVFK